MYLNMYLNKMYELINDGKVYRQARENLGTRICKSINKYIDKLFK